MEKEETKYTRLGKAISEILAEIVKGLERSEGITINVIVVEHGGNWKIGSEVIE